MSDDLPTLGKPEQPDVGQQLELEPDRPLLGRRARLGAARRAIGRGREVDVAAPPSAPLRGDEALRRASADRR